MQNILSKLYHILSVGATFQAHNICMSVCVSLTVCVCVSVYTCVKCKQNGCHCLCCCCDENAVANTKRAKNASKLLESWKIEFCALPGRTLRTAYTHRQTHIQAYTRIEYSMCLCWFFWLITRVCYKCT